MEGDGPGGIAPWDAVVIGGGPAGLAAATWLGRYRRKALVLDGGDYRNRWVEQSHGYLGADPTPPVQLLERAREDLHQYAHVTLRRDTRVVAARTTPRGFDVQVEVDGEPSHERAHRLVLATGVEDAFPKVDGFFDHYGTDVFHCPTCDGYEFAGKDVVALGWNAHLAAFALGLLDWAKSVTVVTEGAAFEGDDQQREAMARHGVTLVEDDAVAFVGERGGLRAVRVGSGDEIACDAAAFSIAHLPRNALARDLGCDLTAEGCVAVDSRCETSVRGVYAAGDVTPGMQLIQVAAGEGAVAGIACAQSLRGESGAPTSPAPAPDPEAEAG